MYYIYFYSQPTAQYFIKLIIRDLFGWIQDINNLLESLQNMVTLRFRNDTKLVLSGSNHYMVHSRGLEGVRPEIGVLGGGWKRCDSRMCNLLVPHRYHHWWMKHHFFSMQPISWAKSVGWCPPDTTGSKLLWFWF